MQRRRSPQEDKALDYERQHFSPGKYDKAFRKNWPKKKAHAERRVRRGVASVLMQADHRDADEVQSSVASIKRKSVSKWGVMTLRERVAHKLARRKGSVGAKARRRVKRLEMGLWLRARELGLIPANRRQ